ncbi:MAG: hypothetical protein LBQ39_05475 [Tannerellaceae bacterium]|jgi:hypothetical protein|nr:hypothetical protein [Tannerellaceae bacterium]
MNDNELKQLIDAAYYSASGIPIPEGLGERLSAHIDDLAANEKRRKRHRFLYRAVGSVAAAGLLCAGLFFSEGLPRQNRMTDTFTDPAEAAIVAGNALAFMSTQLNKGLEQISDAKQEINKVNQILYKQLKKE